MTLSSSIAMGYVGVTRWSDMGVFARIMTGLAAEAPDNKTISIDASYLKTHHTASRLGLKKGGVDA